MKIALYYPATLPVARYGGAERIVVNQARGLAALGHEVVLLAGEGTRLAEATVVPLPHVEDLERPWEFDRYLPAGVDVFVANAALKHPPTSVPWVQVLHGNRRSGVVGPPNTIHISDDHARRHGSDCWVYNGVDPAEVIFSPHKGSYDLFLGRLNAAKGYHWAIAAAKRMDRSLIVAGAWRPSIDHRIRRIGGVGGQRKATLLAKARLFWMPALWDEPFGLTLVEAMASGTPVLGTRRGSLPEIITPDVGRLGSTLDELIDLVPACEQIAPEACRDRFEKHFTHRVMAAEYERMLKGFVATGVLPAGRRPEERRG